jgi:hypothetical protein
MITPTTSGRQVALPFLMPKWRAADGAIVVERYTEAAQNTIPADQKGPP